MQRSRLEVGTGRHEECLGPSRRYPALLRSRSGPKASGLVPPEVRVAPTGSREPRRGNRVKASGPIGPDSQVPLGVADKARAPGGSPPDTAPFESGDLPTWLHILR